MASFDWLSDLQPLFAAQESWNDGSYNKTISIHLGYETTAPFIIACGAGLLSEHIRRFRMVPQVVQRLGQVTDEQGRSVFQESFLNHLQRLRLRVHANAAPEGTLLLPGEPILIAHGPLSQMLLLESAFRLLIWESTHWATVSALEQWKKGHFSEEETPPPPGFSFDTKGWKLRARYIGGADIAAANEPVTPTGIWTKPQRIEFSNGQPLSQIRRLFKGEHPLGDVWLTEAQDAHASVSHTHIQFTEEKTGESREIQMSRFQNLMQPVLVKGHPALNSPSLDYLRQRTWKQLEAFKDIQLADYPHGWALAQ